MNTDQLPTQSNLSLLAESAGEHQYDSAVITSNAEETAWQHQVAAINATNQGSLFDWEISTAQQETKRVVDDDTVFRVAERAVTEALKARVKQLEKYVAVRELQNQVEQLETALYDDGNGVVPVWDNKIIAWVAALAHLDGEQRDRYTVAANLLAPGLMNDTEDLLSDVPPYDAELRALREIQKEG